MSESETASGRGEELSADESERLSRHVAGVSASGLPLGPGLRALAEESPRGAFRSALIDLAAALERGVPLDRAVESEAGRIPPHLRGLIRAGVRTGDLGDILGRFSAVSRVGSDLRRTFWSGLIYPILAVGVTAGLFILVDALVVDRYRLLFSDFGVELPAMTRLLLALSSIVRALTPILLATFLALVLAWAVVGMVASRSARDGLVARTPVVGTLWRFTAWAEFCHLLAMLVEANVPLPEALRLTGEAVEDRNVERACLAMARGVEQGAPLSVAMAGEAPGADPEGLRAIRRSMPAGLPRLLRWAEDRAALAEVLNVAGETFQARSRAEVTFGGAAAAFLAATAVIAGLFIVVVGMFLPLITLVSRLSG
jgi:type II secretory pathway component PulF